MKKRSPKRKALIADVTDQEFESSVIENVEPVLASFWATWCAPCRMMAPNVEAVARDFIGDIKVVKIDVDENPETAKGCGIKGIPTVIIFNKGSEKERIVGATSQQTLQKLIQHSVFEEEFKPKATSELAALTVIDERIRLISLFADGTYKFLDGTEKYHNILYTYSSEGAALRRAVAAFEEMINDSSATEQDFHDFFERYPDSILHEDYKQAHSKILLERKEGGPLIPDFVLEPFSKSALCDLLELKTPLANAYVVKKNRMRFSATVMEAVAQLREYSSYFDEVDHQDRLEERYGLKAYKPRMYLVLGRTGKVSPIERRKIEFDIPGITLRTYDDVLERMKRKVGRTH